MEALYNPMINHVNDYMEESLTRTHITLDKDVYLLKCRECGYVYPEFDGDDRECPRCGSYEKGELSHGVLTIPINIATLEAEQPYYSEPFNRNKLVCI